MELGDLKEGMKVKDKKSNLIKIIELFSYDDKFIRITFQSSESDAEQYIYSIFEFKERFEIIYEKPFNADSKVVNLLAEYYRFSHSYIINPLFATETSLIDILPHQMIAVYDYLTKIEPLRFLLADDAGAGKTIMAGLFLKDKLFRNQIERILVIPPAGLVENWERELRTLFNLKFKIIRSKDCKQSNPFAADSYNKSIISLDTIRQDWIQDLVFQAKPYDVVIFDEVHKLSAHFRSDSTVWKSKRFAFAEKLSPSVENLLLLTATPHMGKEDAYYFLWKLLEPELFSSPKAFEEFSKKDKSQFFLRRLKEEMVFFNSKPLFKERRSWTINYPLRTGDVSEYSLYRKVTAYCEENYSIALERKNTATGLAMTILQRRLASSTWALLKSLERRFEKLKNLLELIKNDQNVQARLKESQTTIPKKLTLDEKTGDEETFIDGMEESEKNQSDILKATNATTLNDLRKDIQIVSELMNLSQQVYMLESESKFEKLWNALQKYPDIKVLIFSEFRDTVYFLINRLEAKGLTNRIAIIHGGIKYADREKAMEFFRDPLGAKYMVATDAAGEGINLQFCWIMVNYDIPWNPARIEQRMGRIHRYKQKKNVLLINLVADNTREGQVLEVLLTKLETIRKELGNDKVFDIIGQKLFNVPLNELITKAVLQNKKDESIREIESTLTQEHVNAVLESRKEPNNVEIKSQLPRLIKLRQEAEQKRLMPSFIKNYFSNILKLLSISIDGNLDTVFRLKSLNLPTSITEIISNYPKEIRGSLTFQKGLALPLDELVPKAIYLHPGEPIFEGVSSLFLERFSEMGLNGSTFLDANTKEPYLFYLATFSINAQQKIHNKFIFGIKLYNDGKMEEIPTYHLLDLFPSESSEINYEELKYEDFENSDAKMRSYILNEYAKSNLIKEKLKIASKLPERLKQIKMAYTFRENFLIEQRKRLKISLKNGDPAAQTKLKKCDEELEHIEENKNEAIKKVNSESDKLEISEIKLPVRALVLPIIDEGSQYMPFHNDDEVEQIAMDFVQDYEINKNQAELHDVHDPKLNYHFDFLSKRPEGEIRYIEVKGRAKIGQVALTEPEWLKAQNESDKYWLYVVFNCTSQPFLKEIKDPYHNLKVKPIGGVLIDPNEILKEGN